jgi:SSS family solute:Na+ symporter
VTSAFELLESRLGKEIRLIAAVMYLALRLVWMALLIHIAAKALAVIIGAGPAWVPLIALVTGLVAATYASVGGLRTVVIADVLQFSIFICSSFIAIALVTRRLHGFVWWPAEWSPYWDRQPWFSFDPHVRVSVFSATLSWLFFRCATAGGDQGSIQRFMATKDEAAARRSYAMNCWATVLITLVLSILGLALLGFFSRVPGALAAGMSVARNGDDLFPYFISHHLPIGVTGLVVSAVVAAAFSSVDSGINSVTAVFKRDILERFGRGPAPAGEDIQHARWTAFAIGVAVIGLSLFAQYVTGNIMEMTVKVGTIVAAPNFSLFILALWVPWVTPLGALAGCAYGVVTASLFCFWDRWTGQPPLSFQWEGPLALAVALAVAMGMSRWGPRRENRRASVRVAAVAGLVLAIVTTVLIRFSSDL